MGRRQLSGGWRQSPKSCSKQLDKNSDGVVTDDELGPEQQRMFQRLLRNSDKNSDGKLSRDEFLSGTDSPPPADAPSGRPGDRRPGEGRPGEGGNSPGPEQIEMIFKQLDANGDGKIVIAEVPEERRGRFTMMMERVDVDGDNALTLIEFTKGMTGMRGGQPEGGSPDRPPMPPGPGPGDSLMRAMDTNHDGTLSKDEIAAAPQSLKKLDRNDDGEITRSELGGSAPLRGGWRVARWAGQPARRQGGQGFDPKQMLQRMDKNGDGKLSKDEVGERMRDRFGDIDANGDGYIDASELGRVFGGMRRGDGQGRPAGQGRPDGAGQGAGGQQMLQRMDKNNDGKLSKDELPERMKENFDRLDANSDGFSTRPSFAAPWAAAVPMAPDGPEARVAPDGQGRPDPKQMLKRIDNNGDGKLSKDEPPERMQENFDRIDANSDGFVEADELEKASR